MDFDKLLEFIKFQNQRLTDQFPAKSDNEAILSRTVKLGEEVGEFCNEILNHCHYQRTEKLEQSDIENLAKEFADVIITTLIIGEQLNIDITKALVDKVDKINQRYEFR